MNALGLAPVEARRIVEARLGRAPQDMLEVAVVLEAWIGMAAVEALETAEAVMRTEPSTPARSVSAMPEAPATGRVVPEAITFLVAVLAIACWADPLAAMLGRDAVTNALIAALPISLGLQWTLRSRYLARPNGLALLARRRLGVVLTTLMVFALPVVALGPSGLVAGAFAAIWTAGTILLCRGWALGYAAAIGLGTAGMLAGLDAVGVLTVTVAAIAAAAALALRPAAGVEGPGPGPWARALTAAAIGLGLGVLLVADRSLQWTATTAPAVALLPSTAAAFWGGRHLWRFQQAIPRSLLGVPVSATRTWQLASPALRTFAGAVARLVVLTALLSAALIAGASWLGTEAGEATILVGFGLTALATLMVGVLEAVGRAAWALVSVCAGLAGQEAVRVWELLPVEGGGLIGGAALVLVMTLPVVVGLLARPASTLATVLWVR